MTFKPKRISQTESQLQEYIYSVIYISDNKDNMVSPMLTFSV